MPSRAVPFWLPTAAIYTHRGIPAQHYLFWLGCKRLRGLRRFLLRRPPRLHHRRQFLPQSWTHRLATSGFLRSSLSLLWCRLAPPFCPALFHRCRDTLPRCRAQATTFLPGCWFCLACLWWTASPCGLGTEAQKSCNCTVDMAGFLSELCHYVLNVHLILSLIAI